ncbi:MAG: RnfABCDGE type electron transport complex subunit B [Rhizobacter sp.]|nr:RnfABCDGE type electron transport complex subunit B [Burkholderiales bacterium]
MSSVPISVTARGNAVAAIAAIDALLPQTQCQRCSFADCHAYAAAVASGDAEINRCPPGGEATRRGLFALLDRSDEACLTLADDVDAYAPEHVAFIDEAACIGCAACLPVCPTDAIIGASKRMHTVIADDCTGCELCIIACPVDCIALVPMVTPANRVHTTLDPRAAQATTLKRGYDAHKTRFLERAEAKAEAHAPKLMPDKKALLAAILARAKART